MTSLTTFRAAQQTITTAYAADGRIASEGFEYWGELKNFSYSYLPGSNLVEKLAMPSGITLTQSYEEQRDLLTQMSYHRGSTLVARRTYAYDALGRPTLRDTARNGGVMHDTFTHNTRSELVNAQVNGEDYTYAYDNIGNRTRAQEAAEEATQYEANALNQYTAVGDFTPQFDAAGNQTLVKTSTGIWRITYNAENRPTTFTSEDGFTTVECTYDYMGRRATKKVTTNGEVTLHHRYIYRGYLQIAACDLTRTWQPALWYILWDPTQATATRPLAIQKDGTWYTYGWDLTKNITELYSPYAYILTTYTYSPYGAVTANGDVEQPIQWSSEFNDEELGLVYYNFRHYNPLIGRWETIDSIKDDLKSMYKYTGDPIIEWDIRGAEVASSNMVTIEHSDKTSCKSCNDKLNSIVQLLGSVFSAQETQFDKCTYVIKCVPQREIDAAFPTSPPGLYGGYHKRESYTKKRERWLLPDIKEHVELGIYISCSSCDFKRVALHETQHAVDRCRKPEDNSLDFFMCSEIRAYSRANVPPMSPSLQEEYLRRLFVSVEKSFEAIYSHLQKNKNPEAQRPYNKDIAKEFFDISIAQGNCLSSYVR